MTTKEVFEELGVIVVAVYGDKPKKSFYTTGPPKSRKRKRQLLNFAMAIEYLLPSPEEILDALDKSLVDG